MSNKPYTLYLQFETFEKLWNWKQKHLSEDLALYEGNALDPEFKGIGRAPSKSVVVRLADDELRQDFKLEPEIVEGKKVTKTSAQMCPRCQETLIPTNEHPGEYPGAVSRADNKTEICSSCGHDEAMKDFFNGGCEPKEAWPIWLRFEPQEVKF